MTVLRGKTSWFLLPSCVQMSAQQLQRLFRFKLWLLYFQNAIEDYDGRFATR